jgi:hypothetical protein
MCCFSKKFSWKEDTNYGADQNSGFIFTIDDESKGIHMKGDSEFGLALGVGALCKAAIGKLL